MGRFYWEIIKIMGRVKKSSYYSGSGWGWFVKRRCGFVSSRRLSGLVNESFRGSREFVV